MEWFELFPKDREPTNDDIINYLGKAKELWTSLTSYIETTYKTKPKLTYSGCSGMPGWNVKYNKSGVAFGTFYPRKDEFYVMIIISYKLDVEMMGVLPFLSKSTAQAYKTAGDYMKMGKWMMLCINSEVVVEDYKKLIQIKLPPKT